MSFLYLFVITVVFSTLVAFSAKRMNEELDSWAASIGISIVLIPACTMLLIMILAGIISLLSSALYESLVVMAGIGVVVLFVLRKKLPKISLSNTASLPNLSTFFINLGHKIGKKAIKVKAPEALKPQPIYRSVNDLFE